ncbi:unnamed protein product [Meganyctiphanes norvegica]|uniref:G-protein coupled receptors family 1 profile domain-containing protein n=1 Tax=Meganyctiphanes norvegica TaxID=48144 RepID=A0AAV2PK74_MEGNR
MLSPRVICSHIETSSEYEAEADPIYFLSPDVKNMVLTAGIFAVITSICGTFSNLLILLAVGVTRQVKTTSTIFVLNLSVAEFLFSLIVLPMVAAQCFFIYRYNCSLLTDDHCAYFTTIRYALGQIQVQSIMAIAFTRAIAIGIPSLFEYINRGSVIKAYIAFIWIYSVGVRIPVALGEIIDDRFGSYDFNNKTLECDISTDSPMTREVYIGLEVYFPIVFIWACYIFILMKVKQSTWAVRRASYTNNTSSDNCKSPQHEALNERDLRVLRSVFIIFMILLICAIPVGITHRGNIATDYPTVFISFHIMYWFQYSIDPVVYSIMNVNYREAFKDFFKKIFPCS